MDAFTMLLLLLQLENDTINVYRKRSWTNSQYALYESQFSGLVTSLTFHVDIIYCSRKPELTDSVPVATAAKTNDSNFVIKDACRTPLLA